MCPDRRRDEAGVTLIEMVISIAILGIALGGTLLAVSKNTGSSGDPMIIQQAVAIANSYLDEIMLKPFYDPDDGAGGGACPTAESDREDYDNVCDYDGLDDSGARDLTGTAISGLEGYRIRVTVDSTGANLGALTGATVVERVDVRVTNGDVVDFTLSSYRTQF